MNHPFRPAGCGLRRIAPGRLLSGVVACLVVSLAGCSNLVETRAITAFSTALQDSNLEGLKESTSSRFDNKALRLAQSIDDIAILRLPTGEMEVLEVDEISENEKRITVEFEKPKKKYRYKLVREDGSRKWVVDDLLLERRKGDVVSKKPVTELMDLVTTVREFLIAWDRGGRADMLEISTPEFGDLLGSLPNRYLARLAKMTIGDRAAETRIRPEAQIDDDVAIVRLPRRSGQMLISFHKEGNAWLIDDLAVESREDNKHIPSVRQLATALKSATQFLDAYNRNDKAALAQVSQFSFFHGSLDKADLRGVRLPDAEAAASTHQIRLRNGLADFMISDGDELVKISLQREEGEDSKAASKFLVSEVTIYEVEGKQEKRLSAMFLSQTMVDLFAEALQVRDLQRLRLTSTPDFQKRVWDRLDEGLLLKLEMPEIEIAVPKVLTTVFMGAVTEVSVRQGSRALVYVLKEHDGDILVDDVLMPVLSRPNSLKTTLEVMVPIERFAAALTSGRLTDLQLWSSRDLNLDVWHRAKRVPYIGVNPHEHFDVPLTTLQLSEKKIVAGLGDNQYGARVVLIREADAWVVDDVLLIAGPELKQRFELKETMRLEISRFRGAQNAASPQRGSIEPSSPSPTDAAVSTPETPLHDPVPLDSISGVR